MVLLFYFQGIGKSSRRSWIGLWDWKYRREAWGTGAAQSNGGASVTPSLRESERGVSLSLSSNGMCRGVELHSRHIALGDSRSKTCERADNPQARRCVVTLGLVAKCRDVIVVSVVGG